MMYYALKSALLLTLLYGGFSALLSRETFHRFNRIVLLGIVLLSMGLPAVQIRIEPHPLPLHKGGEWFVTSAKKNGKNFRVLSCISWLE